MVNETGFQLKVIIVVACLVTVVTQKYSSKCVVFLAVCCWNELKTLLYLYL